jgi:hypothetical protein
MLSRTLLVVILSFLSVFICDVEGFVIQGVISIGKDSIWSKQLHYYNRRLFSSEISPYPENCQHHEDQVPSSSCASLLGLDSISARRPTSVNSGQHPSHGVLESVRKCLRENDSLKGRIDLCNQILGFVNNERRKLLVLVEDSPTSTNFQQVSELSGNQFNPVYESSDVESPVSLSLVLNHKEQPLNNHHNREAAARLLSKSVRESLDHSTTEEYQQIHRKMNHPEDHHKPSSVPSSSSINNIHHNVVKEDLPFADIHSDSHSHSSHRKTFPVSSSRSSPHDITRVSMSATSSINLPHLSPPSTSKIQDTESYYKENYVGTQVDMNQVVKRSQINWNQLRNSGSSIYQKAQGSRYEPLSFPPSFCSYPSLQRLVSDTVTEKSSSDISDATKDVSDMINDRRSLSDESPPLFNSDGGLGGLLKTFLIDRT